MLREEQGVFGPKTVRRMDEAYQYAHHIIKQRAPSRLPTVERQLARQIVDSARKEKSLPRKLVRSVVRKFLFRN